MASDPDNAVTVMIVDDHHLFSDELNTILETDPGITVLAQVYDSREARAKIAECHPHVVLMDYNMPYLNGVELTELLLRESPELKILIVSMYNEEPLIEAFRLIGAKGYLFKTASADEVITATRKVCSGEFYFPKSSATDSDPDEKLFKEIKLSDRELDVARLFKAGLKTREIARALRISYYTAEAHKNNIKLKAGLKSDADFTRFILEMRLPPP